MPSSTFDTLINRVHDLEPLLREHRDAAEAERELPSVVVKAMVDAGLLRAWIPKEFGGFEIHPTEAARLWEEIARIDSAAGWIASNQSAVSYLTSIIPDAGGREIFADPDAVIAGGWFPPAPAIRVDGGYRVTGQWSFGSGCKHATWLTGQGIVMEGGQPILDEQGQPTLIIVFFPSAEGEIVDTWKTLGMRGTGSNDIRVEDLFVPDSRVFKIGPITAAPAYSGPLYALRLWIAGPPIAAVMLGIARAAIDDLLALAAQKTPSYTTTGLADRPIVQEKVARAVAMVDGARAYLHNTLDDAWDFVATGATLPVDRGLHLQLAATHTIVTCQEAVDIVQSIAGTTGIREAARFQRYFRDAHTASQHAFGSASRFESVGKLLLERESDWGFFYL